MVPGAKAVRAADGTATGRASRGTLAIDPAATVHVTSETVNGVKESWTAADFNATNTYTIVEAGAVDGTFATVSSEMAFLRPELSYTATTVGLTLSIADIRTIIPSIPVARGAALNELVRGDSSGILLTSTKADAETWQGDDTAAAVSATSAATGQFNAALDSSMASARVAAAGASGINTGDAMNAGDGGIFRTGGVWTAGLGSWNDVDVDGSAAGFTSRTWGLSGGVDTWMSDDVLVGVALGYAGTTLDSDRPGAETEVDSIDLGVYGSWTRGPWYVNGTAFYAHHGFEGERTVSANGGATTQTASSDYDGHEFGAGVEVGRTFATGGIELQPYAGLDVSMLNRDGYSETGLTGNLTQLALVVEDETFTTGRADAGLRVAAPYTSRGGWPVVPAATVGVAHRFGDTDGASSARYTGGTTPFEVAGPDVDRTVAVLGLGLSTNSDTMGLFIDYDGEFNAEQTQHTVNGGIVFRW